MWEAESGVLGKGGNGGSGPGPLALTRCGRGDKNFAQSNERHKYQDAIDR